MSSAFDDAVLTINEMRERQGLPPLLEGGVRVGDLGLREEDVRRIVQDA